MIDMEYKYFKKFNSPIIDYISQHYGELRTDFFNNIASSQIVGKKPWYLFGDGVTSLYQGQILSAAMKLANKAIDDDERKFIGWNPADEYRYTYRTAKVIKDPMTGYRNYNYLGGNWIKSPWADFIDKFDDQLEQMFFNIAYPGAKITPHKGIANSYFRVHICLQNNRGFVFDIAGEKKYWEEGPEGHFAFDDGNLRHGVDYADAGDTVPRVVAIIDVKKSAYPEMFGL